MKAHNRWATTHRTRWPRVRFVTRRSLCGIEINGPELLLRPPDRVAAAEGRLGQRGWFSALQNAPGGAEATTVRCRRPECIGVASLGFP
jgi:hypothetical protein